MSSTVIKDTPAVLTAFLAARGSGTERERALYRDCLNRVRCLRLVAFGKFLAVYSPADDSFRIHRKDNRHAAQPDPVDVPRVHRVVWGDNQLGRREDG